MNGLGRGISVDLPDIYAAQFYGPSVSFGEGH